MALAPQIKQNAGEFAAPSIKIEFELALEIEPFLLQEKNCCHCSYISQGCLKSPINSQLFTREKVFIFELDYFFTKTLLTV